MEEKISEIKKRLKDTDDDKLHEFIKRYEKDERSGVTALLAQAAKRMAAYEKELARMEGMMRYEREYAAYSAICGIDEVGRGPLAGPVVAGAVILPKECRILYLNDSKIGFATEKRIDEINILNATYEAMRMAIEKCMIKPDILLNDAVTIPQVAIPQVPIIKGDAKSISIGAASIIAKVTRDRLMVEYDKQMPEYGFARNKGYGSAEHIEAIRTYGASPIHRRTFISNFLTQA